MLPNRCQSLLILVAFARQLVSARSLVPIGRELVPDNGCYVKLRGKRAGGGDFSRRSVTTAGRTPPRTSRPSGRAPPRRRSYARRPLPAPSGRAVPARVRRGLPRPSLALRVSKTLHYACHRGRGALKLGTPRSVDNPAGSRPSGPRAAPHARPWHGARAMPVRAAHRAPLTGALGAPASRPFDNRPRIHP